MAGEENGDEFIGIDERAIGDDTLVDPGRDDEATRPLSMGLENRIDGNVRYIQERGSQCTKAWYTSWRTEIPTRPYTSVAWSYLALVPFELQAGMDEIRCKVQSEIGNNDGNTSGQVEMALELRDKNGRVAWTGPQIKSSTTGVQVQTLSLDLSNATIERGAGSIGLMMRSLDRSSSTSVSVNRAGPRGWGISYGDGTTADNNIDETVSIEGFLGSPSIPFHKSSLDSNNDHITGISVDPFGPSDSASIDVFEESFVKPISAAFEVRYTRSEDAGFFQDKAPKSMQAQTPALGRQVSQHGQNLDHLYTRPKCRAIGPKGQDKGEGWDTGYRRQWTWVNVTDTAQGDDARELDRQHFEMRHTDTSIRCIFYTAGLFGARFNNQTSELVWDVNFNDRKYREQSRAVGDMDFKIEVEQIQGGQSNADWSAATSLATTTETIDDLSFWHLTPADVFPVARQAFWSRRPQGESNSTANEYRFPYHEGQIFEDDLNYLAITGLSIDLDIDFDDFDDVRGNPVRANLIFDQFTGGNTPSTDDVEYGQDFTFHLLCLGTSWWEVPQL